MAVALVGSVGTASAASGTSVTGAYGQSPTASNVLVAVITRTATTAGAMTVTGPGGTWAQLIAAPVTNSTTGGASVSTIIDVWWKIAAGGDATPTFTLSGGSGTVTLSCTIFELSGANWQFPLDVSGTTSSSGSGTGSATIASITTTTSGNVTASGEFAISGAVRERAATTGTTSYSASWNNGFNSGSGSSTGKWGVAYLANPSSGATASDVTTWSSTSTLAFGAGVIVVIAAAGPQVPTASSGQPAGVRVSWLRQGSVQASIVQPAAAVPPTPAVFYPLGFPRASRARGFPQRGRTAGRAGVYSQAGPPVYPLRSPVAEGSTVSPVSRNGAQPPLRGRTEGRQGTFQGTGSPVYPLRSPVAQGATSAAESRNGAQFPSRGRSEGRPGTFQGTGSAFYPRNRAAAVTRPVPPRGRTQSLTGTFQGTGPAFIPFRQPVAARIRVLPPRGRIASQPGTQQGTGPQIYPARRPAAAVIRPQPVRGRTAGRSSPVTVIVSTTTFYPLNRPCAAVTRPVPPRGRTQGRAGTYDATGPAFYPLNHPVRARQPLPPKGTTAGRSGVFTAVIPATVAYPLTRPVAAVTRPLPPRGRTEGRSGTFQGTGPVIPPPGHPVRSRQPLPPRGTTQGHAGVRGQTGPPVTPLQRAIRARLPQQPPPKGTARGLQGTYGQAGPPVIQPHGPVRAAFRILPRGGRITGHSGTFQGTGPAPKPLQHPVYAWRPGPRRGVTLTSIRPAPPSPTGAPFRSQPKPVRAWVPPPRRGQASGRAGAFVFVPPGVPAVFAVQAIRGQWQAGPLSLASDWQAQVIRIQWEAGPLTLATDWQALALRTQWEAGPLALTP